MPQTKSTSSNTPDQERLRTLEAALLDSQMRLRGFYDAAPLAILQWSREGRITDWNRMAESTFGHTREAAIGQKLVPLLIHPDEYGLFSTAIAEALRSGMASHITCRTLRMGGQELLCEWRNVPLRTAKGSLIGILSLVLDVTERIRAEESLRQSRDMTERLSRAKSEFMATISHELRTPLNGILGMAQLLHDMPMGDDEKGFVRLIEESGQTLLDIINAIVGYTEIDATPPEESVENFSIAEILALAGDRHGHAARQKGLTFDMTVDDALMEPLVGDRRALEKILLNLIDNAVRFTDTGGVRVAATREPGAGGGDVVLRIEITDTGVGMSHEFLEKHLYTPFKQAENAIVRKRGGVGIGLALAKKLVDRVRGGIEVASEEGKGTTFTLRLPLSVPPSFPQ